MVHAFLTHTQFEPPVSSLHHIESQCVFHPTIFSLAALQEAEKVLFIILVYQIGCTEQRQRIINLFLVSKHRRKRFGKLHSIFFRQIRKQDNTARCLYFCSNGAVFFIGLFIRAIRTVFCIFQRIVIVNFAFKPFQWHWFEIIEALHHITGNLLQILCLASFFYARCHRLDMQLCCQLQDGFYDIAPAPVIIFASEKAVVQFDGIDIQSSKHLQGCKI